MSDACPAEVRCPDRRYCPLPCQEAGSREDPSHRPEGFVNTPTTERATMSDDRERLTEVLAAHRVTGERLVPEHGCGGDLDRCLSMCPVPYSELMPPEEIADQLLASDALARIKAEAVAEAGTELLKMAAQEFAARGPHDPRGAAIWDAGSWLRDRAAANPCAGSEGE